MTTGTVSRAAGIISRRGYYYVDDEVPCEETNSPAVTPSLFVVDPEKPTHEPQHEHRGDLASRWQYTDVIPELLSELIATGRSSEAAAIERVLGHDDDEAAMRAYVSRLWADDWDSDEDSVYDG
jgi:hypothetical protein